MGAKNGRVYSHNLGAKKLRQEDCKFEVGANLGYIVYSALLLLLLF